MSIIEDYSYHKPVLFDESIEYLVTDPSGVYIDATMGGGGHSKGVLNKLDAKGRLFPFDRDSDAITNVPKDRRVTFVASDFRYISNWMLYYNVTAVHGILADLGVSSHHFDEASRGFSFRFEDSMPDMRMNTREGLSARELLLTYSEEDLATILYEYGELTDSRKLASLIVKNRNSGYHSMGQLIEALSPSMPGGGPQLRNKLSRVFQAIRIEINDELGALRDLLTTGSKLLAPGGRMAIITYHSLEDRLVKDFFRHGRFDRKVESPSMSIMGQERPLLKVLTKKPILPSEREIAENTRARSAKLRVAEKL